MDMQLPKAISAYFQADQNTDATAIAECFSDDAVVTDEQNVYRGRDAIRRWKDESSAKFSYTVEPFAIADDGHRTVVTSHLVGDFPGSPIDLRYFFVLKGDKIAELEIIL
ncbi:nuclear transport factor 2 family protein [Rhizobium sp. C4]|uniref:nuclear transport factor 2 family protein n=1 Tax=Rhizobium sp. C4 TaxID=1349800 RepID=UPI001E309808|nr:nuclear transport factor 2 family protein [Rhizobium sp. C4]MCD2174282.1 nuclear transport factor 2 family protein [Rhizobium sp. C4]